MTVALVMGNMIGSGIFLLPASLAAYAGLSLAGWLVSTGGALVLAAVFAYLAQRDPAAGGPYAYTRRAFGDLPAFLVGWGYWISIWTSLGALAVAFAGYLGSVVPLLTRSPAASAITAIAALWLLIAVNAAGIRSAGRMQVVTTVLKVLPLLAIGAAGLVHFESAHFEIETGDPRAVLATISATATLTLWAFLGLESATVPAAGIENPGRTIPRATIVGTLLTAAIYIVSTVGVMSLVPPSSLGQSQAPFADAARTLWGGTGATIVALGASLSAFGALNGWVLLVGQLPLAVARDGLFPRVFTRMSRRDTPTMGMLIAGVLTTILVALNYTRGLVDLFTFFILLSTLNTLIPYVFSSLAVFLLGDGHGRGRVPHGIAFAAALAFAYSLWAIGGAGQEIVYWGFLLIVSGLPVYVWCITAGRRASGLGSRDLDVGSRDSTPGLSRRSDEGSSGLAEAPGDQASRRRS
jgi:APA family basic amino acid/polyamine antiporter